MSENHFREVTKKIERCRMSDLISRESVMEMLTNIELSLSPIPITEAKLGLKDIPTAFDVNKVVEQLKVLQRASDTKFDTSVDCRKEMNAYDDAIEDAIEIVQKGGAE